MQPSPALAVDPIPTHGLPGMDLLKVDLLRVEEQLDLMVRSVVPEIPRVGRYLIRAGGKRLRPILTLLAARQCGQVERPPWELAAVGELIHLASLLHDDVVDEATLRRGQASANRIYGNGLVVLVGDYCLASALQQCTDHGPPAVVQSLARAVTEMAQGEVLQLQQVGRLDTDLAAYMRVIEMKSAALISWCCRAGALVAGAGAEAVDSLARYGRELGVAFQIADDILDYAGTEDHTGKALTADLRGLKVTLPLLLAVEREPGLAERLELAWRNGADPNELGTIAGTVEACGALGAAQEVAAGFARKAVDALGPAPTGQDDRARAHALMTDLAQFVVDRHR
jgi:octaprenyl-diphosphate synthase